ncbi:MAG: class I SAM-dependent methyltransferase [Verrucomicrobiota bacterium]|jgi:SAM-dependent methyltransferase|nr:class I SAM-dependent methyltransferase [Verrucomicrobiaceae bacterium]MDH4452758.1 class I SAM-dependent methyltransferase [Verrucomicrobiota bacterium]
MSAPTTDETTLFRQSWTLYDSISEMNYMFHREIYAHITALLSQRHAGGPYSLLDLGCGNTRFIAPCLKTATPSRYAGVDLSEAALKEAREYLSGLENVALHHQDMLQAVQAADASFEVIFSGFAVHHLDAAGKQQLFHACAAKLAPGGQFILVDVVREEGQTREQYLKGYLNFMRTQWTAVRPDHLEEACAHVAAYDFPETLTDLKRMAAEAALTNVRVVDCFAQHHVLVFSA